MITDIVVGRKGVRIGETELEDKDPDKIPPTPPPPPAAPEPPSPVGKLSAFVDFIGIDFKRGG